MGTHAAAPAGTLTGEHCDPEKGLRAQSASSASRPEVLAVRKDLPPNNLKEFVAYAKANESKLNAAHAGVGSVSYVGCLLLHNAIGIKPTLVPFTGTAPVWTAMLAGQVDYVCDPILGPLPACTLPAAVKALAIASKRHRSSAAARSPDLGRAGVCRSSTAAPFYAAFAPKGTPKGCDRTSRGSAQQGSRRGRQ